MDKTIYQILEDIGLTNAQIKVYIALLELGESTSGPIIQKSKLQNSVVYNAINHLIEKGLISFIQKGKRKYFQAADPRSLIHILDQKKKELLEILPQLTQKKELSKNQAKVFIGWKGIYTAFNSILEVLPKNADYIGFAAGIDEQYSEETKTFFRVFNRKRLEMKYNVQLICNESARKSIQKMFAGINYQKKDKMPEYRYLSGFALNGVIIFKDNILLTAFEETPTAVIITSKTIANSFRKVFENCWEIARK